MRRNTSRSKLPIILAVIAGIACIAAGAWGLKGRYQVTHDPVPLSPEETVSISTDAPSETPVPVDSDYQVAPDMPRSIHLPTIGTEGLIQKVGVDQTGSVAVPNNVHMAGWFRDSAKPGDPGLSIIDGHVHGVYEPGVFVDLAKLKAGDEYTVNYGDGSVRSFKVDAVEIVVTADATKALYANEGAAAAQLNLITCTGTYDKAAQSYDKRVIVRSTQL
jgi:LPXTG-site transpeptidase (sortase) family protein